MDERRPVSKRLRYEVLRRDDHTCRYCGGKAPDVALTVDHVLPVALGGDNEAGNLVTACDACNSGKTSTAPDSPIVENVADDALRWAAAMEKAAEIRRDQRTKENDSLSKFVEEWDQWTNGNGDKVERPGDWERSVLRFIEAGLDQADLAEAINITMTKRGLYGKKLWSYFCGVCWNLTRERQAVAKALLDAESGEGD